MSGSSTLWFAARRLPRGGAGLVLGMAFFALAALSLASVAGAGFNPALEYRDGPPPGFSGGFGEQSCHACHFSADVNDPAGGLAVTGLPDRPTAGQTYPLTVTLVRPGLKAAGFQLTSRFTEGGRQAGSLSTPPELPARVTVTTAGDVTYAYQRLEGSAPVATDTARWVIMWTAPPGTAAITLHAAANAADGDDSVEGDFVYTTQISTQVSR